MNRQMLLDNWMLLEAPLRMTADQAAWISGQESGWLQDLRLPCDVHQPLIDAGKIKDPVLADYAASSDWIEQRSWWFRRIIRPDAGWAECDTVELVLESLDVHADVFLNGAWIGHQASAHYPFRRDIRKRLRDGDNELLIRLTTGLEYVSDADLAEIDFLVSTEAGNGCPDRGDKRRAFLRKPTYVFGWDWCPRIATCGIVKEAWLEYHQVTAIRGVHVATVSLEPQADGYQASLRIEATIELLDILATADADLAVTLSHQGEPVVTVIHPDVLLCSGINYHVFDVTVDQAALWWPNGMGDQPLYDVEVSAVCRGHLSGWPVFQTGIRTLTLDTSREDAENRRFALQINGQRMFCKGGDWIPADSIYARVSDHKYRELIRQARAAHFNMLRIWGGGLYEQDIFYRECDKAGILIWQDMMFGCSAYPDHRETYRDLVGREFDYQTAKLRNHACLALFCGNNEDHWLYGPGLVKTGRLEHDRQYGLLMANVQMPEIIRKNCPNIPYWNSSPYGGVEPNADQVGDIHHWGACMMNPEMANRIDPRRYDLVQARFVTEYGYPGPIPIESIRTTFDGQPIDRTGRIWNLHNNTFEKLTVEAGIKRHYTGQSLDLEPYLLYAGMTQSLMLGYSLEAMRFKSFCSGALFWMYNDCWGEVGWTIVDYYLRRKISFYGVRRAFAPQRLILRRDSDQVVVVACNDTPQDINCRLLLGWTSFDGLERKTTTQDVVLPPFSRGEAVRFDVCGDMQTGIHFAWPQPVADRRDAADGLLDLQPGLLSWGEYRQLGLGQPQVSITAEEDCGADRLVTVHAETFAHGVYLDTGADVELSDNYFDLLPGESRTVRITGAAGRHFDLKTVVVADL